VIILVSIENDFKRFHNLDDEIIGDKKYQKLVKEALQYIKNETKSK